MPKRNRTPWVIIVPAVIILIAAAILWWNVAANEGFARGPVLRASAVTLAGILFLLIGIRGGGDQERR